MFSFGKHREYTIHEMENSSLHHGDGLVDRYYNYVLLIVICEEGFEKP